MKNDSFHFLKNSVQIIHGRLVQAAETIDAEQFSHAFSKEAPPIGWHLWHMARFADRLQAKLAQVTAGSAIDEIWYGQQVAQTWDLVPDHLGVFESGMGQRHEDALQTIIQVGQAAIITYAQDVFTTCNATLDQLTTDDLDKTYFGIQDYGFNPATGEVWAAEPKESTVGQDIIFHANHGSRHMGMMEALRGLLGTAGTLSV